MDRGVQNVDEDQRINDICDQYYREVYQFCLYYTSNQQEAEDLTQETFLRVLKKQHLFKKKSSIKTWIISIAKNVARDHHRKKKVRSILHLDDPDRYRTNNDSPESALEEKEKWEEVQLVLMQLRSKHREIIILRTIQGYSVKETADILRLSEANVRVLYHRALKAFSMHWEQKFEEGWMIHVQRR